jgi:PAS domain S-box-containing protein
VAAAGERRERGLGLGVAAPAHEERHAQHRGVADELGVLTCWRRASRSSSSHWSSVNRTVVRRIGTPRRYRNRRRPCAGFPPGAGEPVALRWRLAHDAGMSPGQAEAQLAALIGATDDAVVATDAAGRITSFSPGAERLCGVRAQDVVGRRADSVVPAEGAEQARGLLACVAGGGGPTRLETHWPAPDGRVLRIELALAPIHGEDGIEGVSIVGRDVTARHAAERALRESRERARLVVETAPDPFVAMDEAGRIVAWNAASERMFGWSPEEALGRPLADVVPAHRARLDEGRLRIVADGPRPSDGAPAELVARHRDGTSFPVELVLVPVRMGGRWLFNGFARDLRLRDEAELARRRLAAIVESTGDAVLAEDAAGRITSWNEGAERLFGWAREEVVGKPIDLVVPPGTRPRARAMREQVLAGERLEPVDVQARHRDGAPLEVALTMSPVRADDGAIVGVSMIARDVGPRRRADRAERAAQAERLRRATHDELTGLPSRRGFAERVDQHVGTGAPATVAVVDVARFHALNDALGRAGGDEVLRSVAGALAAALPGAVLGRLEADRFAGAAGPRSRRRGAAPRRRAGDRAGRRRRARRADPRRRPRGRVRRARRRGDGGRGARGPRRAGAAHGEGAAHGARALRRGAR